MTRSQRYLAALAQRGLAPDPAQQRAVTALARVADRVEARRRREAGPWQRALSLIAGPRRQGAVQGLYLWGGVGRGKTLLMDLFAEDLGALAHRQHFHRFIQSVHERLRELRAREVVDPLATVARDLAARARVLCLDELYVSDIADAMLLGGLFAGLTAAGMTLVTTSNSPPSGLYRDGLQRSRFLPAIALLEQQTTVLEVDSGTDYRLRELERAPLYLVASAGADAELEQRFRLLAGASGSAGELRIEGRPIPARRWNDGGAWFDFAALCSGPRGTADYIEIARQFQTVLVSGVPVLGAAQDDEARRFIALVDEFYERSVKLVVAAAAPPDELYRGTRLGFEFQRAASRLTEMQSRDYLARPHRP